MLEINPKQRIKAEEALKHPYLSDYYDPADIVKVEKQIDFNFEYDDNLSIEQLEKLIRKFNKIGR